MTKRTQAAMVLVVLAQALTGCDRHDPPQPPLAPSSPGPVVAPQPGPAPTLLTFTEPGGFSTTDVRDAQDDVVQFNSAGELIWTADGTPFPGYFVQAGQPHSGSAGM